MRLLWQAIPSQLARENKKFVVQGAASVYPIEAKAERNLQAKSLKSHRDRFSPAKCLRTSLSERNIGKLTDDIPLYAVSTIAADYLSRSFDDLFRA